MTAWHQGPLALFDTETTGIDVNAVRIVTATLIDVEGDPRLGVRGWVKSLREWLIAVDLGIPAEAEAVHGVSTARSQAEGMAAGQGIFEIVGELALRLHRGVPVVGYNLAFDLTILDREARRHGVDPLSARPARTAPIVDAFVIDKACDPYRKGSRKLADAAAHYRVAPVGGWHTATADALAAGRVAHALAEAYPVQVQRPLAALHDAQVAWKAEQATNFQRYLRTKKGQPDAVVDRSWPVQPLPTGWDPAARPAAELTGVGA